MAPALPEGGYKLRLAASQPCGHLIADYHGDAVSGCHSDELLGSSVEETRPLREVVEVSEWKRYAVDHEEADPRVLCQKLRQQLQLGQKLHVVMATNLRDNGIRTSTLVNAAITVTMGQLPGRCWTGLSPR